MPNRHRYALRSNMHIHRFLLLASIIILWEYSTFVVPINRALVAVPSQIATVLWEAILTGGDGVKIIDFYYHLQVTVYEVVLAYALSVFIGLFLGFALGTYRFLGETYEPILLAFFAFPLVVVYPMIFLIVGIGTLSKLVIGLLIGFFYIVFNTTAGVRQVDPTLINLARSMGFSKLQIFYKIIVPAAAPTIMSGLRLGFGYTFIGVIVGELLVPNIGLGYLLTWASSRFFTPELFALIVTIMLLSVTGDTLLRIADSGLSRWNPAS